MGKVGYRYLKAFLIGVALGLLTGLMFVMAAKADVLELDALYVDYKNFKVLNEHNRNMLTYPEPVKEGVNLGVETTLVGVVYWNSIIEGTTTDGQYRGVGLDLKLGVRLSPYLEFGYYHHSQHVLDRHHPYIPGFPVEDALQLKIYFYKNVRNTNTLF